MTLFESFDDPSTPLDSIESSVNLNSLYCSHLWANSNLRSAIITAPCRERNIITYCYTCKGKIRKYELKSTRNFTPHNHSTPNKDITIGKDETYANEQEEHAIDTNTPQTICSFNNTLQDLESTNVDDKQRIPSISQQIDSSFRQKYTSYEMDPNNDSRRRLRKSLRGFGCIVNFASTDSSLKKRTQIQACSISVMIVAIVIISFILVNFASPNFKGMTNKISTTVVPTKNKINETSNITNSHLEIPSITEINLNNKYFTSTESSSSYNTENSTSLSVISKIRKNIRTYPKLSSKTDESEKPKDVNNRDLSQRFCTCQKNEICMLDENSGTSLCRKPTDDDDPTGTFILCNQSF